MSVEDTVFTRLKSLTGVDHHVYRDVAPQKSAPIPRIVFQQVGGDPLNFVEGTAPSKKNARFQVRCWAGLRDDATALAREAEDAMRPVATVLTGIACVYEPETKLYGTIQDFSVWFDD